MGKNFSRNNIGKRKASDLYETPYSLTQLLLNTVKLRGSILEPACGNGAIVKVLNEYGYICKFYDIETDFLKETDFYDTIITNPPYSLSLEFIIKAKEISDNFFFLLPISYLHGITRYKKIYTDHSFNLREVFVFTRYPLLGEDLRDDGKHHTGMMAYAWYWFDRHHLGKPEISWLNNNPYVLRKDN
jgi:hypothetical protein